MFKDKRIRPHHDFPEAEVTSSNCLFCFYQLSKTEIYTNIYKDKQPIITYEKLEPSFDRLIDAVLVSESLSEDNFIKLLEQDNQNLHKPQNIV